ncbi:hypothetical protein [Virgisporangium aurantiacum]|uniref:Uncharacterized protein n=1 Tax=Virgisporangium aurantiacum TaxID=175570 RepID=A0A8J4E7G1_9ACTN|nr:hypothetical protein [Virgisporangium aurantiacum]GIJ65065.1 hypothetical protein Vau01_125810 [Virgisporangium aurantiacum]
MLDPFMDEVWLTACDAGVSTAIEKASTANPLFPQRVVEMWHHEAAAVPPSTQMPNIVAQRVEGALPAAFNDPLTVRTALAIHNRRPGSHAGQIDPTS